MTTTALFLPARPGPRWSQPCSRVQKQRGRQPPTPCVGRQGPSLPWDNVPEQQLPSSKVRDTGSERKSNRFAASFRSKSAPRGQSHQPPKLVRNSRSQLDPDTQQQTLTQAEVDSSPHADLEEGTSLLAKPKQTNLRADGN